MLLLSSINWESRPAVPPHAMRSSIISSKSWPHEGATPCCIPELFLSPPLPLEPHTFIGYLIRPQRSYIQRMNMQVSPGTLGAERRLRGRTNDEHHSSSFFHERKAAMAITIATTNALDFPPSLDSFERKSAEEAFQQSSPSFETTSSLDDLRRTEYARLDEQKQVYLDYTGGGLYAESQLREHMELLRHSVFGNPHSTNPTSQAMTELVEHVRRDVLEFFHASPDEYRVIFTANASGALKLVGEAYP